MGSEVACFCLSVLYTQERADCGDLSAVPWSPPARNRILKQSLFEMRLLCENPSPYHLPHTGHIEE